MDIGCIAAYGTFGCHDADCILTFPHDKAVTCFLLNLITKLQRVGTAPGQAKQTALTRGFTGRLARGIKNRLLDELNQKDTEILPYPLQRALVRHLSIPAEKAGRPELLPLWAGQSANLSRSRNVHALLDTLVKEISEIGGAVQSWSACRQLENAQE